MVLITRPNQSYQKLLEKNFRKLIITIVTKLEGLNCDCGVHTFKKGIKYLLLESSDMTFLLHFSSIAIQNSKTFF